ncbi:antibiotic biosynthesis monooxygenase [Aneurinibacillus sp. Ricciae_BoGa-3]|uniref:putative quinol monooxygenase n=1 Tax=Aneurinibacillus sp. Ricciae_BoGa-3 TaxID=3022697 RepID=UPI002340E184|nr:antibiotic biosynthesis monooxygenase [Aneurinibacillus sp. Ricciae_BoGa-3]WCK56312.1 antibiotic biosynthesis monooxygenase [Aneurinibacillus sp. Ricciae_BoGa-3]
MVTVVWETWLQISKASEGLELTRRIWSDMKSFKGYCSHSMLVDQDNPAHILVVSQWESREAADRIRDEYADSQNVKLLAPLLEKERNRWVFDEVVNN